MFKGKTGCTHLSSASLTLIHILIKLFCVAKIFKVLGRYALRSFRMAIVVSNPCSWTGFSRKMKRAISEPVSPQEPFCIHSPQFDFSQTSALE